MQLISIDSPQRKVLFGGAGFAILLSGFFFWSGHSRSSDSLGTNTLNKIVENGSPQTDSAINSSLANAELVINVAGKVLHPGVYKLTAGSRVVDAIEMAGGALKGVDLSDINLARVLSDGEQVLVGKSNTGLVRKKISPENPLDINIATASQFDQLPGIGPVTAQRIITLRKQLGRFQSVDDLKKVTGLGGAKFLEIKALLKV